MLSSSELMVRHNIHPKIISGITDMSIVVFFTAEITEVRSTAAVWAIAKPTFPWAVTFCVES